MRKTIAYNGADMKREMLDIPAVVQAVTAAVFDLNMVAVVRRCGSRVMRRVEGYEG